MLSQHYTGRRALFGVLVLVIGTLLFGSYYTVGQFERGVILRNGAFVGVVQPGLGFKIPIFESVVNISTRQNVSLWTLLSRGEYETADYRRQEMQGYSQDQQPFVMRVSILWHVPVDQIEAVYSGYGTLDALESRLIARKAPQDIQAVLGRYTALEVVQKRAQFNGEVQAAVEKDIDGPVVIDDVQVESIDHFGW